MPNTLKRVKLDELLDNDNNARSDIGDVEDLAESIVNTGLLEPLVAYKDGDKYRLIAGHRRRAAIALATANGLLADDYLIDVVVRPKVDDTQQLAMMLVENMQRVDLPLMDQVHGIFALVSEHGWTQAQVAEALGQSVKMVKQRAKWAALPDVIITRAETGQLRIQDLDDLAGLPEDVRSKLCAKPSLSSYDIVDAVQAKKRERARLAFCRKLAKLGHIVIDTKTADGMPDDAREFLDGLTKKATTKRDVWHEESFLEQIASIVTPALVLVSAQHSTFKLEIHTEEADAAAWEQQRPVGAGSERVPDDQLTDYERALREMREARDAAVKAHHDSVTGVQVEWLTETKPALLISTLLMSIVQREVQYGLSATASKLLLLVTGLDGKDTDELLEFAGKNSTNLARVAGALSAASYQGITVPGVEALGSVPSWDGFRVDPHRYDEDGRELTDEEYEAAKAVDEDAA